MWERFMLKISRKRREQRAKDLRESIKFLLNEGINEKVTFVD